MRRWNPLRLRVLLLPGLLYATTTTWALENPKTVTITKTVTLTVFDGASQGLPIASDPGFQTPAGIDAPVTPVSLTHPPNQQIMSVCPTGHSSFDCVEVTFGPRNTVASVNVVHVAQTVVAGKTTTIKSTAGSENAAPNLDSTLRTITRTAPHVVIPRPATVTVKASNPGTAVPLPPSTKNWGDIINSVLSIWKSITNKPSTGSSSSPTGGQSGRQPVSISTQSRMSCHD